MSLTKKALFPPSAERRLWMGLRGFFLHTIVGHQRLLVIGMGLPAKYGVGQIIGFDQILLLSKYELSYNL